MLKIFKKKQFDIEAFIASSMEGLKLVTETHKNKWNLGQEQSWKVDESKGTISFSFADGSVVTAPIQIVGTFNATERTFIWAWGHASVIPALQQHSLQARSFGTRYSCVELTTQTVSCNEKRAWEYTALTLLLTEAVGAYRVQAAPGIFVFMTFGDVTINKK